MSLGSLNNIYTGWDFVGEINPTSIFSFGWFDTTTTSNDSYQFDVYYGGWNNPADSYNVIANGWFSTSAVSENLLNDISRKYTAGWIPLDKNSVYTNGWFSTSAVSEDVNILINLSKFNLSLLLNEVIVKNSSNTLLDVLTLSLSLKESTTITDIGTIVNLDLLNLALNINSPEVYFEKDVNVDLNKLVLTLNLKEPLVNGVVINLDKLVLNMFLKEITVYGWGRFKTFLNQPDVRNINPTVDIKKSSILFEPTGNDLNNSNFGSW